MATKIMSITSRSAQTKIYGNLADLKEDGRFYAQSKSLIAFFLYHDPLLHKIIIKFTDLVVAEQSKNS
jgi:hypothetical protein